MKYTALSIGAIALFYSVPANACPYAGKDGWHHPDNPHLRTDSPRRLATDGAGAATQPETGCGVRLEPPSVPLGQMTRSGNKVYDAFSRTVYQELKSQAQQSKSDPTFVPTFTPQALIRLAFHECIPFGQLGPGLGGSNGSIQHELDLPANARLGDSYHVLERMIDDGTRFPGLTLADAPHVAAAVAVEAYGGPAYPLLMGRPVDATDDDLCDESNFLICWPPPVGDDLESTLVGMYDTAGFTDPTRALVASLGAHTMGGTRFQSEFLGNFAFDFTADSYTFDNGYYTTILAFWDTDPKQGGPTDPFMVTGVRTGDAFLANLEISPNQCQVGLLQVDFMLGDPTNADLRSLVEAYASDQQAWFQDFSAFMQECGLLGVDQPNSLTDPFSSS